MPNGNLKLLSEKLQIRRRFTRRNPGKTFARTLFQKFLKILFDAFARARKGYRNAKSQKAPRRSAARRKNRSVKVFQGVFRGPYRPRASDKGRFAPRKFQRNSRFAIDESGPVHKGIPACPLPQNILLGRRRYFGVDDEHPCSLSQNEAMASVPDVSDGSGIFFSRHFSAKILAKASRASKS